MKLPNFTFVTDQSRLVRVALVLLAVVVAQPFVWRFAQYRVTTVRDRQSRTGQIVTVREQNQQIEQAIKTQQQLIDQLEIIAPPPTALNQVVERLEQLADKQQLTINISSIEEEANRARREEGVVTPVTATIEVKGHVSAILKYIEQLEHIPELTIIQSFTLQPNRRPEQPVVSPGPSVAPISLAADYGVKIQVIFFLKNISS